MKKLKNPKLIKKIFSLFIKKYVRIFPYYNRAVICRFAGNCSRGCPCQEKEKNIFNFIYYPNYGHYVEKQIQDKKNVR